MFLDPSDCKEVPPTRDVWRSATVISGAQCVMTHGELLMLKWLAANWDDFLLVLSKANSKACGSEILVSAFGSMRK